MFTTGSLGKIQLFLLDSVGNYFPFWMKIWEPGNFPISVHNEKLHIHGSLGTWVLRFFMWTKQNTDLVLVMNTILRHTCGDLNVSIHSLSSIQFPYCLKWLTTCISHYHKYFNNKKTTKFGCFCGTSLNDSSWSCVLLSRKQKPTV